MARISIYAQQDDVTPIVTRTKDGDIRIATGEQWLTVSREETVQLAADLLNAAEATPVGMTERAA